MSTHTAASTTGTYHVDPVHSSVAFSIAYQGVSIFRGTLTEVDASLIDGRLEGTAPVESISITTPDAFRAHVLGPEFFDAAAHPDVRFVSTSIDVQDDGRVLVDGVLTIRGVTRPVHATGAWTEPAADAFGNTRANLALEAVIDRRQWGLTWNAPLPSGGNALGTDVTLAISLSLVAEA